MSQVCRQQKGEVSELRTQKSTNSVEHFSPDTLLLLGIRPPASWPSKRPVGDETVVVTWTILS